MHQTTPAVERAVAGARAWADRLGSGPVRLAHFVLALLDEEEGRVAVRWSASGCPLRKSASGSFRRKVSRRRLFTRCSAPPARGRSPTGTTRSS
jgi:hypothetical protein